MKPTRHFSRSATALSLLSFALLAASHAAEQVSTHTASINSSSTTHSAMLHLMPTSPIVANMTIGLSSVATANRVTPQQPFVIDSNLPSLNNQALPLQVGKAHQINIAAQGHAVSQLQFTPEANTRYIGMLLADNLTQGKVHFSMQALDPAALSPLHGQLQVSQGASMLGEVDVYIIPRSKTISHAVVSLSSLNYPDASTPSPLPAGEYYLLATPSGSNKGLSKSADFSVERATHHSLAIITESTDTPRPSMSLILGKISQTGARHHRVAMTPSCDIRVINALRRPSKISLALDKGQLDTQLQFDASHRIQTVHLTPGMHSALPEQSDASEPQSAKVSNDAITSAQTVFFTEPGHSYDLVLANAPNNHGLVIVGVDNYANVAIDAAQLRITNTSASQNNLDIYISRDGDISDMIPTKSALRFGKTTPILALEAGEYVISLTRAGSKSLAFKPKTIRLDSYKMYSAFTVDDEPGDTLGEIMLTSRKQ